MTPFFWRKRRRTPTLGITCIETRGSNIDNAVAAVEHTSRCVKVDCLYWFSNVPYPGPLSGIVVHNIVIPDFVDFFEDINRVYLRLMPKVVETERILIVQSDGFAVNARAWDDRFWNYDYIGAPWPWMWGGGPHWHGPIVGNGGFSLRSRKLFRALSEIDVAWRVEDWLSDPRINQAEFFVTDPNGVKHLPEDILICLWYRDVLEARFGIEFCPPRLANKFSVESICPFTRGWLGRSFGFHGIGAAPHYGVEL
jgi:hypothetical protein